MADGTSRILQADDIRADCVVIWLEGASYATTLLDVGGHWKVVIRPFIAAHKAAEAKRTPTPSGLSPIADSPDPPSNKVAAHCASASF